MVGLIIYLLLGVTNSFHTQSKLPPVHVVEKKGERPKGDYPIDVVYQGNSEVDITLGVIYLWPMDYEILRDGVRIDYFLRDSGGDWAYRDTTASPGTCTYQVKMYWPGTDSLDAATDQVTAHPGQASGVIRKTTVWKKSASPFLVSGSISWYPQLKGIQIQPGCTLRIEAGVKVHFDKDYSIGMFGSVFTATGTQNDMIIFEGDGKMGDWAGITADTSRINFNWVQLNDANKGLFFGRNNTVTISNSWFWNDSVGIYSQYGNTSLSFSNGFIGDCDYGMYCMGSFSPQISSSEFAYNTCGIFAMEDASPVITGSNFCGNKSYAIANTSPAKLSAKDSWWGYPSGPKANSNPKGEGEKLSGDVDFQGFKTCPYDLSTLPLPDFRVDTVIVTQIIDSADLFAARPTVVRVFVSPGQSKSVDFPSFGIQVWLGGYPCVPDPKPDSVKYKGCWDKIKEVRKGLNSVNCFISDINGLPATACSSDVTVKITPALGDERDDTENNEDTVKVGFKAPAPKWRIYYTALRVGDWWSDGSGPASSVIEKFAADNEDFLEGVFPIKFESTFRGYSVRWLAFTQTGAISYLKTYLALTSGNAFAIGIVPRDFLNGSVGTMAYTSVGLYHYTALIGYRTDFQDDSWGTAHELGHSFDLADEYYEKTPPPPDGNPNWDCVRKPDGHMATNGWWVNKKKDGCIYNVYPNDTASKFNNVYSFMGNTLPIKHWIPRCDYNALYTAILAAKKEKSATNRLLVNLSIYKNDSVFALPFYEIGNGATDTGTVGNYSLECLNVSNTTLSSVKFSAPFWEMDTTAGVEVFSNCVVLEYPAGTKKIVLKNNSNIIFQSTISTNPPSVDLISPNGGSIGDSVKVIWSGSDLDGDNLLYALFSKGSDNDWAPIAFNIEDTSYMVDAHLLGSTAKFKVTATDGINSASDSSGSSSSVQNKAPFVFISVPSDSLNFSHNQIVALSGSAIDPEEKTLPESSLVWVSNIDDTIGFGNSINKTLSVGTHNISFSAKDSGGLVSSDAITLFVVSDTLTDVYLTGNDITTSESPILNDTCWINCTVKNTLRDANCIVSIYLNGLDSLHLLNSNSIFIEANKSAILSAMWAPQAMGNDTIWVKVSGVSPSESNTSNNIASKVFTVIAVEEKPLVPVVLYLNQNYPNPAYNSTFIKFSVPSTEKISLKVYDISGKLVKTIVNGEYKPGYYTVQWNADNDYDRKLSSGVYFIRLQSNKKTFTRKTVILK
ncbi:MAG: T9SS type A sorting domain-containing protein [bacterium]|nr:T9SS type A sorting domain-containing protein [bacterium]